MTKHLSQSDRILIEKYLDDDMTFTYISRRIGRAVSTVSREIKSHRTFTGDYDRLSPNGCSFYQSCLKKNLCSTETINSCRNRCKFCTEYDCKALCDHFDPADCEALKAPPYVCNGCPKEKLVQEDPCILFCTVCSQRLPQDTQSVQTGSTHLNR